MSSSLQPSYSQYIKSDEWSRRRDIYFSLHKKECIACGSSEHIDLHHMTYDRLRSERDEDMAALCNVCHEQYHAVYESASLVDSRNFIEAKRAEGKGKEILLKHQVLIEEMINKVKKEYSEHLAVLAVFGRSNNPNYDSLSYKTKQDHDSLCRILNDIFYETQTSVVVKIIRREIQEMGGAGENEPIYGDGVAETRFSLEYRWVAEGIKSKIYENIYTELDKLKGVLMLDEYSLEMKRLGFRRNKTGWHKSGFMGFFGF